MIVSFRLPIQSIPMALHHSWLDFNLCAHSILLVFIRCYHSACKVFIQDNAQMRSLNVGFLSFKGFPKWSLPYLFYCYTKSSDLQTLPSAVRFILFPPNILGTLFIFTTTLLQSSSSQQVACWSYKIGYCQLSTTYKVLLPKPIFFKI